jgi:hypothetical protein
MLEDFIAEINARGYLINNLFQRTSGVWQANLRADFEDGSIFHGFGEGDTPAIALSAALDQTELDGRFRARSVIHAFTGEVIEPAPTPDFTALLALLKPVDPHPLRRR